MSSSIGKSHDCTRYIFLPVNVFEIALIMYSCNVGVEMHRKRHREILIAANLVKKENSETIMSPPEVVTETATASPIPWKRTRKERKQIRKSAANSTRIPATEIFTEADYVFVSEALYGKTTWGKSGSLGEDETVGQESKETEATTDSTLEDGRKVSKVESSRKRLRKAARRDSPSASSVTSDPLLGVDPKILERLGVSLAGKDKWSKRCKEDLKKLVSIIAQDLEITEREKQEVEMRKAGFFRFVNRKTVTNLEELHEQFSWSTGEKKKQARA